MGDLLVWAPVAVLWVVLSVVVGIAADGKGRPAGWFVVLSLVFSPVVGLALVLLLRKRTPYEEIRDFRRRPSSWFHVKR